MIENHNYPKNKYIIEKHQCKKCGCAKKNKSIFQKAKNFFNKILNCFFK